MLRALKVRSELYKRHHRNRLSVTNHHPYLRCVYLWMSQAYIGLLSLIIMLRGRWCCVNLYFEVVPRCVKESAMQYCRWCGIVLAWDRSNLILYKFSAISSLSTQSIILRVRIVQPSTLQRQIIGNASRALWMAPCLAPCLSEDAVRLQSLKVIECVPDVPLLQIH